MKKRSKHKSRRKSAGKKSRPGGRQPDTREVIGNYKRHPDGYGFVTDPGRTFPDVFIPPGQARGAYSGDTVRVAVQPSRGRKGGFQGTVQRIEREGNNRLLATLRRDADGFVAFPDAGGDAGPVRIEGSVTIACEHHVLVEIDRGSLDGRRVSGRIIQDFGHVDDPAFDIAAVIALQGYPECFPAGVPEAAERSAARPIDHKDRLDCRDLWTCTVDPATAKDFDDAVSVIRLPAGGWDVWVHIADVSFYVEGGTALDAEAMARSNSVYLLDRVIPMLPEALSNGVCSLNPGVDRAAKSVRATVDRNGNILDYEIRRTLIHSRRRYCYEEVQAILGGAQDDPDAGRVREAYEVSAVLRRNRIAKGTVVLNLPEVAPRIRPDGTVERLDLEVDNASHQFIEDLMLLANRCVADHLIRHNIPGPFRVHEEPDHGKLESLARYLAHFGYRLPVETTMGDIVSTIATAQGRPESYLVNLAILRSFKQAAYALDNRGHYALGFDRYLHFTSPIRRYADLAVHRWLDRTLFKLPIPPGAEAGTGAEQSAMVGLCNENERRAMDTENTLRTIKLLRFIKAQPAERVFKGIVSNVYEEYIAIELVEYFTYGRMLIEDLGSNTAMDRSGFRVQVPALGRSIGLGDELGVRIKRIEPFGKILEVVPETTAPAAGKKKR
ncbi:MAG: ribonuclease R family protein [Planctomycetota bacterium]